jgi:hypothetical protein
MSLASLPSAYPSTYPNEAHFMISGAPSRADYSRLERPARDKNLHSLIAIVKRYIALGPGVFSGARA